MFKLLYKKNYSNILRPMFMFVCSKCDSTWEDDTAAL